MKKKTVKDFIALYAPEDEEKLVLIQDDSPWSHRCSYHKIDSAISTSFVVINYKNRIATGS